MHNWRRFRIIYGRWTSDFWPPAHRQNTAWWMFTDSRYCQDHPGNWKSHNEIRGFISLPISHRTNHKPILYIPLSLKVIKVKVTQIHNFQWGYGESQRMCWKNCPLLKVPNRYIGSIHCTLCYTMYICILYIWMSS